MKKSKCLHGVPIIECNHHKNLISILKNERDKTRINFIKDNDYISYLEYIKLYPLNKNFKKNSSSSKGRKIDPVIDEKLSINSNIKLTSEENKNEVVLKAYSNRNKKRF